METISQSTRSTRPSLIPRPPPLPEFSPAPFVLASSKSADPEDPIQTDLQQRMLWVFQHQGYWGLASELYRQAQEMSQKGTRAASCAKIVDDYDNGHNTVFLQLLSLPDYIIESLIKNTICYDKHHDERIAQYIESQMCAIEFPRVYLNVSSRDVCGPNAVNDDRNKGRWLSAEEAKDLMMSIKHYLREGTSYNQRADDFDNILDQGGRETAGSAQDVTSRRYAPTSNAVASMREWADITEQRYIDNVLPVHQDIPFRRTPMEVGWAMNGQDRLKHHLHNGNTTHIYGYLNAWSQHILPPGSSFPQPQQFTLFRVWAKDLRLAQVTEIAASMLCSSYITEGGLNPDEAGNFSFDENSIGADHEYWRCNSENVFQHRPHFHTNLQNEWIRARDRNAILREMGNLDSRERELQQLLDSLNHIREQLKATRAEYEALRTQRDNQQAELAAASTGETPAVQKLKAALVQFRQAEAREERIKARAYAIFTEDTSAVTDEQLDPAEMKEVEEKVMALEARLKVLKSKHVPLDIVEVKDSQVEAQDSGAE